MRVNIDRRGIVALAAVVAASTCAASHGQFEIDADLNSLTGSAGGAFGGTTHTGTIQLSRDANSVLTGIAVDGSGFTTTATLSSFSMSLDLAGGTVAGGSLSLGLSDGSAYLAGIVPGLGRVRTQAGQGFRVDGLTFAGLFNGSSFAGIDVSSGQNGNLSGSFLMSAFAPNGSGIDADTQFELVVSVPTPGGAGLLGAAGAVAIRRRRR